ncbi:allophanate hydrolase subunit 1 [Rhodococcus sp. D2-41]|uniref:Allophanate hydrolase subunit 1 n=1 Tax=Speluncibacter jeojiensis TaxID=2710754 RepID=A0A9X4M2T1_9ACTN|nr:allophanate hydrolase subunit 1 [Rhodococcus sp. D2-41]MDG3010284.1 allophanate hydrolase subunit 1 [Rhodococcus sp. D2-41]MDG3015797.1 allophanate hydrolase subunit 1 [Corynebacteriales bacterium D3-21]
MRAPTVRSAGDRALLLEPADPAQLSALVDLLTVDTPEGVEDVLPAARTILVTLTAHADRQWVGTELVRLGTVVTADGPEEGAHDRFGAVTVPVRYDGEDLHDVATLLGCTADELITEHTSRRWRCSFLGFAPGFGYLEPDRPLPSVPRRTQSRTAVPAGAVALAGGYSAVYPRRSPGGWQLIGTTDTVMWDLDRAEPSLLRPGTVVRFVDRDRR